MKRFFAVTLCLMQFMGLVAFAENADESLPVMRFVYWMPVEDVCEYVNRPYRKQGFFSEDSWNVWVWGEMRVESSPFLWYTLTVAMDEEVPGVKVCGDLSITMVEYEWGEKDGAKVMDVKGIGTMISLDKKLYAREDIEGVLKGLKLSSPVDKMLLTEDPAASDLLETVVIPVEIGDIRELKPTAAGKTVHILLERDSPPQGSTPDAQPYQAFLWRVEDPSVFEGEAGYLLLAGEKTIYYGAPERANAIRIEGEEPLTAEEATQHLTQEKAFLLVSPLPYAALVSTEYVGPCWIMECTFGAEDRPEEADREEEKEKQEINWNEWSLGE